MPLRLLRCSSALLHPSAPLLCRAFPSNLNYSTLSSCKAGLFAHTRVGSSVRAFSSRPMRHGRGLGAGGQGRGLIDDEAELSDWVGDLKTDFFREGSDIGSEGVDRGGGRRGGRGRDRGLGSKRMRGSESDEGFDSFSDGKKGRGPTSFFVESDGDDEEFPGGRGRGRGGARRGRGADSFSFARRGETVSNFDRGGGRHQGRFGGNDRGNLRGRDRGSFRGLDRGNSGGRDMGNLVGRGRGRSGFTSPSGKRGGRVSELGRGQGLDRRKASFTISEEEDDDDSLEEEDDSLEDESDEEDEFVSEDEAVKKDAFGIPSSSLELADGNDVQPKPESLDAFGIPNSTLELADGIGAQPKPKSSEGNDKSYLSETRFDQCSLSPLSLKGIKAAGYERMTMVQEATLPVILKGQDVLAKAKTGTGKTVAFLLPAIEIILKQPPVDRDNRRPPMYVLVICPTRELANQASMEANTLLKYHPNIGVQFVTGGTRLALEQKRMQANPCQILVATPGRLRDHTENTPGFATRLMGVKILVLDEADHLLDMGFRKDIEKIIASVSKQRQTLLFSATVPDEVRHVCHIALRRDHEYINTVEEGSEETHSQVSQKLMIAPLDKHFSLLYHILHKHVSEDVDYKVLVFCTTAMVTRLVAAVYSELKLNVREIHSRKPQSYRTRVSDEFRKSKGLILVTSDVSARGVDYPDVTLVIQVGVPSDREQYIHRLGRTGRKGKEGQGILMLAPWEEYFVSSIKEIPISKASLPQIDPDTRKKVERALACVQMINKEAAYQAWLGYYNSNKSVGRDKYKLVELANEFSKSMGLDNPPAIKKVVLGKMGLRNIPGLRSK